MDYFVFIFIRWSEVFKAEEVNLKLHIFLGLFNPVNIDETPILYKRGLSFRNIPIKERASDFSQKKVELVK